MDQIIANIKRLFKRQPSGTTAVAKLTSGTVLIADGNSVLILTQQAARTLADRLTEMENLHERQHLTRQSASRTQA